MTNHLQIPGSPPIGQRRRVGEAVAGVGLADLEKAYVIEDRSAAIDFIQEESLQDLLLQAREPLAAAFGPQATKVLRLVHDPDDRTTSLFCLVLTPGDADAALKARWAFERNWWMERCGTAVSLNFDFELV
jgi:hypothetical protein